MNQQHVLPAEGYVRLWHIVGGKGHTPKIPVSHDTWWRGIKEGRYPPPVKLGPNTTAWRVEDIRQLIETGEWRGPAGKAEAGG